MRRWYFRTIRTYTQALMNFFKNLEVLDIDTAGNFITTNVPFAIVSKEKSDMYADISNEQHLTGNVNILPRGVMSLISIQRADQRQTNRNLKINKARKDNTIEFSYNSVAYSFIYEIKIYCRGMNEACMLLEEIAPRFNPNCSIDVFDTENLPEPTRVPIKLVDINISEYEPMAETTANIFIVDCTVQLEGQLYSPITTTDAVKHLGINLYKNDTKVSGFDFDTGFFEHTNPFQIKGFNRTTLVRGTNVVEVLYDVESVDNLEFLWSVEQGDGIIRQEDGAKIVLSAGGKFIDISCKISNGIREQTIARTFIVE